MDILEDIKTDYRNKIALIWFKWLCAVIFLALICTGCFIYYNNSLKQQYLIQDVLVGDMFIKNCLGLEEYTGQEKLKYKRPANEMLEISQIQTLLRAGEIKKALERLDGLILSTRSEIFGPLARIIWMSVSLDLTYKDKEKFQSYINYCARDDKLFWSRANILGAIFFLKNNQMEKSKELLEEVIYSQKCSPNVKEEAKSILNLIR